MLERSGMFFRLVVLLSYWVFKRGIDVRFEKELGGLYVKRVDGEEKMRVK